MRIRASYVFAAFALCIPFLSGVGPVALAADVPPGGTFVDDNYSSQEPFIEAIFAAGITRGCNPPANDRYCPEQSLTRAQMATMLVRALGPPPSEDDRFNDDDESIHHGAINALATAGITRGMFDFPALFKIALPSIARRLYCII